MNIVIFLNLFAGYQQMLLYAVYYRLISSWYMLFNMSRVNWVMLGVNLSFVSCDSADITS